MVCIRQGDVSEDNGKGADKVSLINNLQMAIIMTLLKESPQPCLNDTRKIVNQKTSKLKIVFDDSSKNNYILEN
ncbi:hypothetical protein EGR_11195 [Echinococcus granulosus]|uniref:Uncharacterized protein n=1 Tax=Echinococcus granulosus TaxID=6210 RepID=W6TZ16_ECHGR|nr:hypothetical protein EGR_11195 [Echinococcus granulosus]EUB53948.1 hypothetical protein EGR_11195 [Echinococcus granulosus]